MPLSDAAKKATVQPEDGPHLAPKAAHGEQAPPKKEWGMLKRIFLSTEMEYSDPEANRHRATKHLTSNMPHLGSFTDFGTLGTSPSASDENGPRAPPSAGGSPERPRRQDSDKFFLGSSFSGGSLVPFLYDRFSPKEEAPLNKPKTQEQATHGKGGVWHREWDPNTNLAMKAKGASRFDNPAMGGAQQKSVWEMIDKAGRPEHR
jgi:hypothetical protein